MICDCDTRFRRKACAGITKLRNAISYADPYETVERKASAMALLCDDVLRDFDGTLPCGVRGRRLFYLSER